MIAKIKTKKGVYSSVIFGILVKGNATKAIIMNESNTALQIIDYWKSNMRGVIERSVFEIDSDTDGWIKTKNFEGYDWICQRLKRGLFKIKIGADDILDKCKEMQSKIINSEWHNVKTEKDIKDLDALALNFHDAAVEKIDGNEEKTVIEFYIWSGRLIVELDGDVGTNLYVGCGHTSRKDGRFDEIYESDMFFENECFYWINAVGIKKSEEIYKYDDIMYFRAKNVRWKVVI